MYWLLIALLTLVLFFNRYLFLDPRVPVRLPGILREMLRYSAPCILTAICAPIILLQGDSLRAFPDNPYFLGALLSVAVSYALRKYNTIFSVLIGMGGFYLLSYFVF